MLRNETFMIILFIKVSTPNNIVIRSRSLMRLRTIYHTFGPVEYVFLKHYKLVKKIFFLNITINVQKNVDPIENFENY